MELNTFTHLGKTIAELVAENAQLKDIEAANKVTIKYWRGQVAARDAEIARLRELLSALIWPNVPSGDDIRLLLLATNAKTNSPIMEFADRLNSAQDNARAALEEWPTSVREWVDKQ